LKVDLNTDGTLPAPEGTTELAEHRRLAALFQVWLC
jgi:hypothetical protein